MKPYTPVFKKQKSSLKEAIRKYKESLSAIVELDTDVPTDEQILRVAVASEQSAINLYQQLINYANNELVKKVLMDIIDEEKVHIGEFEHVLLTKITGNDEVDLRMDGINEVENMNIEE